jgi:hypothetical protein
LDFDGVICDSAIETSITAWKACQQIWQDMPGTIPERLIDLFRLVRPALETGYEAILIIRLLFKNVSAHSLLEHYEYQLSKLISQEKLSTDHLKNLFGSTRDSWIANNGDEWLEMNPLFEGVANKLPQIEVKQCFIITTKQERFVHQILAANNITLPKEQVYGLDRSMTKRDVLTLLQQQSNQTILFVEDRLPTLVKIKDDPTLDTIKLFFADWGYNTEEDKRQAQSLGITRISLSDFNAL